MIFSYGGDGLSAHVNSETRRAAAHRAGAKNSIIQALLVGCLFLGLLSIFPGAGETTAQTVSEPDTGNMEPSGSMSITDKAAHLPIYNIPLRIHLAGSGFGPEAALQAGTEINRIWMDQARICFNVQFTRSEQLGVGLDLWFQERLSDWNGYYLSRHEMYVRDEPDLSNCNNPAKNAAGRTAAHEIGHALGLSHRQDSNDNLMRSKTFGWQLNAAEIARAREIAQTLTAAEEKAQCRVEFLEEVSGK